MRKIVFVVLAISPAIALIQLKNQTNQCGPLINQADCPAYVYDGLVKYDSLVVERPYCISNLLRVIMQEENKGTPFAGGFAISVSAPSHFEGNNFYNYLRDCQDKGKRVFAAGTHATCIPDFSWYCRRKPGPPLPDGTVIPGILTSWDYPVASLQQCIDKQNDELESMLKAFRVYYKKVKNIAKGFTQYSFVVFLNQQYFTNDNGALADNSRVVILGKYLREKFWQPSFMVFDYVGDSRKRFTLYTPFWDKPTSTYKTKLEFPFIMEKEKVDDSFVEYEDIEVNGQIYSSAYPGPEQLNHWELFYIKETECTP